MRAKLREAVTAIIADATEATATVDRLGMLVCQDPSPPSADPEHQPAVVAAWTGFVEALACSRPTVVVIEDLHEADASLLDAVEGLADRIGPVPLLVVGTARPELLTRRPAWGGGKRNATTITLSPLSDQGSTLLLDGLLAAVGTDLPGNTRTAVLARAAGNPLYLREYARMLADRAEPTAPDGALPIPETIHQLIAARLDALPAEQSEAGGAVE